jgi:hypothetical protein
MPATVARRLTDEGLVVLLLLRNGRLPPPPPIWIDDTGPVQTIGSYISDRRRREDRLAKLRYSASVTEERCFRRSCAGFD